MAGKISHTLVVIVTDFCSFHLEISHCDAPRAHSSSRRTAVTNLEVKTVADRVEFDVKPSLAVKGLTVWSATYYIKCIFQKDAH